MFDVYVNIRKKEVNIWRRKKREIRGEQGPHEVDGADENVETGFSD